MPVISRFYGIAIYMFWNEGSHQSPHVHAKYQGDMASFEIRTGRILAGALPPKACMLVREFLKVHRKELEDMWRTQEFRKLPPLT